MHRQLQVSQTIELRLRQFPAFGGALAALESAAERQMSIGKTQFRQQRPNFGGQFAGRANLAQGFFRCRRSRAHAQKLPAFKFPATQRPFGIDGAGARGGVKGRTRLRDA